jgi:hypothetical protein
MRAIKQGQSTINGGVIQSLGPLRAVDTEEAARPESLERGQICKSQSVPKGYERHS